MTKSKLILSYFLRKTNVCDWPIVISDIVAEYSSYVLSPLDFHIYRYIFINIKKGSTLVWDEGTVGEGFTFPKPNILKHGDEYDAYKAMSNYIIKAKEWKIFAWEFCLFFLSRFFV